MAQELAEALWRSAEGTSFWKNATDDDNATDSREHHFAEQRGYDYAGFSVFLIAIGSACLAVIALMITCAFRAHYARVRRRMSDADLRKAPLEPMAMT